MDRTGALLDRSLPTVAAARAGQLSEAEIVRCGDAVWEVAAEWRHVLLQGDGLPIDRWLRDGRAATVKRGAGRMVYRVDLPHHSFFIKHLRDGGLLRTVKDWFRVDACRREYEKARELVRRGVPGVLPVALGQTRRSWGRKESFLVTEAVPAACSLDEYVDDLLPKLPARRRVFARRRLIDAVVRLCAAAHEGGVFHDDLHGGNILVRQAARVPGTAASETLTATDDDASPQLFLVDLPGIQLTGPLDEARSRDSLAMICAGFADRMSDTDRLRFWRAYVAARPGLPLADACARRAKCAPQRYGTAGASCASATAALGPTIVISIVCTIRPARLTRYANCREHSSNNCCERPRSYGASMSIGR
ncbi:MAG: lipopolysaccharide kinase InaA family protein [Pirellulales bacterium]